MSSPCDDLIARIEDEVVSGDRDDRTRAFFIETCNEIAHLLPPAGARWMEIAEAYAQGAASRRELTDARLNASSFTEWDPQSVKSPQSAAVEAVLFTLTPDDGYDAWSEAMSLFIDLCERAGMDRAMLCERLREAFEDVLE